MSEIFEQIKMKLIEKLYKPKPKIVACWVY